MPIQLWCFGPFQLDPETTCLWRGNQLVPLPPKPFAVLAHLVAHAGDVVTKSELVEAVWPETVVSEGVLKTCINQIRKALGETAYRPKYIATLHRRGYRFLAPVTRGEADAAHAEASDGLPAAVGGDIQGCDAPPVVPTSSRGAKPETMPRTRYTRSGEVNIAYQVLGDGPFDVVYVPGWITHLEYGWQQPRVAYFLRRLSSFARLILFDKRGTGLCQTGSQTILPWKTAWTTCGPSWIRSALNVPRSSGCPREGTCRSCSQRPIRAHPRSGGLRDLCQTGVVPRLSVGPHAGRAPAVV
jgi:DNA-binding winged helix-turn-helix (wHTH) protein